MTFIGDLSTYTYRGAADPCIVAVGWLDADHRYPQGEPDRRFRDRLVTLAADPVEMMRGFHDCQLCDEESPIVLDVPGDGHALLGSGEIRITASGLTYAAPTLIIHYIDSHAYRPPEEFRNAVLSADRRR
jgi:hypothetical protein